MDTRYFKFILSIALFVLGRTMAENISLCTSDSTVLCNNYGFDTCKKFDTLETCICKSNNTRTLASDVLAKDLTCYKDSGNWHDPYHWVNDLTAATFLATLIFGALALFYAIYNYAVTRAIYNEVAPHQKLHYIPLFTGNEPSPSSGSSEPFLGDRRARRK